MEGRRPASASAADRPRMSRRSRWADRRHAGPESPRGRRGRGGRRRACGATRRARPPSSPGRRRDWRSQSQRPAGPGRQRPGVAARAPAPEARRAHDAASPGPRPRPAVEQEQRCRAASRRAARQPGALKAAPAAKVGGRVIVGRAGRQGSRQTGSGTIESQPVGKGCPRPRLSARHGRRAQPSSPRGRCH